MEIVVALLLALDSMKLKNAFFDFLGRHVFSIYILQRIPMMFFKAFHGGITPVFSYFAASFAMTVAMAVVFDGLWAWAEDRLGKLGKAH